MRLRRAVLLGILIGHAVLGPAYQFVDAPARVEQQRDR